MQVRATRDHSTLHNPLLLETEHSHPRNAILCWTYTFILMLDCTRYIPYPPTFCSMCGMCCFQEYDTFAMLSRSHTSFGQAWSLITNWSVLLSVGSSCTWWSTASFRSACRTTTSTWSCACCSRYTGDWRVTTTDRCRTSRQVCLIRFTTHNTSQQLCLIRFTTTNKLHV